MKFGNKGVEGCKKGIKCPNFHPRMCTSSFRQVECLNESCTFAHVKGTKWKASYSKDNQNNTLHKTTKTPNFQNKEKDFLTILEKLKSDILLQEIYQKIVAMASTWKTLNNLSQYNPSIQYNLPYRHQAMQQKLINLTRQTGIPDRTRIWNCKFLLDF